MRAATRLGGVSRALLLGSFHLWRGQLSMTTSRRARSRDVVITGMAMMAMMTESIAFVDSDESGTLTTGDFVMINNATLEADGEWNFARLYSAEADSYSDENPMMSMLPGFTGFIATIGLLGAALIRRE